MGKQDRLEGGQITDNCCFEDSGPAGVSKSFICEDWGLMSSPQRSHTQAFRQNMNMK